MLCCKKKNKVKVNTFSFQFLHLIESGSLKTRKDYDDLWEEAKVAGKTREILLAKDADKDTAVRIASRMGNITALKFVLEKLDMPEYQSIKVDINQRKHDNGFTPLLEACKKGYIGAEFIKDSEKVRDDRYAVVKLLIEKGADVNIQANLVKMTPLHWACYNNDFDVVKLLLDKGAVQTRASNGNYPVDIAGVCGYKDVVNVICKNLRHKVMITLAKQS